MWALIIESHVEGAAKARSLRLSCTIIETATTRAKQLPSMTTHCMPQDKVLPMLFTFPLTCFSYLFFLLFCLSFGFSLTSCFWIFFTSSKGHSNSIPARCGVYSNHEYRESALTRRRPRWPSAKHLFPLSQHSWQTSKESSPEQSQQSMHHRSVIVNSVS